MEEKKKTFTIDEITMAQSMAIAINEHENPMLHLLDDTFIGRPY